MNTGNNMKIEPFKEHRDELFSDYAMQLFNAHCGEDSHKMIKFLVNSLEEEAEDNPAFMPGLVFGCMVHMLMMMQLVALEKGVSMDEANLFYSKMYQGNRKKLAKMLGNRPDYAKGLVEDLFEKDL
jgi:hypothetical protein